MYCKNCGEQYVSNDAVMCVKCGVQKGVGRNYCPNCGQPTAPESVVCLQCGVSLGKSAAAGAKSKVAAGLLAIFLGCFGVHNFYLGYTKKAVLQLVLTIVGFILSCIFVGVFLVAGIGIWALIEGIMILCGSINVDGQGNPLA